VLILDPFGRDTAPFSTAVSSFRNTLAREMGEPVDFYQVPLELARFQSSSVEAPLVTLLNDHIKESPIDMVVPIGGAGLQFVAKYRERLFPDVPVLILGAEPRTVPSDLLQTNATLVTQKVNLSGFVEDILQMQPRTTNIVVVFGSSALERFWAAECKREYLSFTNQIHFTWIDNFTFNQLEKLCSSLPPDSFILYGFFLVDASGVPWERSEALKQLHEVANAPIFSIFKSEFGMGPIGGHLFQDAEIGVQAAYAALKILRGARPEHIHPYVINAVTPVYDWRELKRWGIKENNLPSDRIVEFRQPGFWMQYRWTIAGVVFFFLLETVLIVSLLINRTRRIRGEAEASLIADISSKFVNIPSDDLDGAIIEAERRIGEFLEIDLLALWQISDETPDFFTPTHYYSVQKGSQPLGLLRQDDFPWYRKQMLAGRIVVASSLKDLPPEAAIDRKMSENLGVKSNLTFPLSVGGQPPIGILGLNTTKSERAWPDALVKRLQLVAQIFANALARKKEEQKLQESEMRMMLAAEAADFGVWSWSIHRNRIWGSEKWLSLFGFVSGEAICFEQVMERIHPDDRALVEREVRRAVGDRMDYEGEFRVVVPDGSWRWIVSRGRAQVDANGARIRMLGAAIDVTERKVADERFRMTVEASPNGIVLVNSQGRIVMVNKETEKLFGYLRTDLIGEPVEMLIPERYRNTHPDLISEYIANPQARDMGEGRELYGCRKDGSQFPVEVGLSPIQGTDEILVLATIMDMTEKKQAEARLRNLSGQLIRAHEMERARLGRELHDDITQRVARLAIDAGWVIEHAQEELVKENMRSTRDGLVRLSEDIHALSYRLHPSVLEDLGLSEALKAECERFTRQQSVAIDITLGEMPSNLPPEMGLCLFRVVQEALRNVGRHAGARRVEVTLRAVDDGIQLVVTDDGVGFDPDSRREHPSLGLASMRERVLLLNGELDIETEPGAGTTILVWIPMGKAEG